MISEVAEHSRKQSIMSREPDNVGVAASHKRVSRQEFKITTHQHHHTHGGRRLSQFSRSSLSGLSAGFHHYKAQVQFQNSYRLGPDPGEKFQAPRVEQVMRQVLESYLGGGEEQTDLGGHLVKEICEVIKGRVRELGFSPRYKYVSVVTLADNQHQSMAVVSRGVWDTDTDNVASVSFSSGQVFAVANIFATYFE